jgi:hypothetical protein
MNKLTAHLGAVTASVEFDRYDIDGVQYRWEITCDGETLASGDDLRSGAGDDVHHAKMLASLLTFASAAVESFDYGDSPDDRDSNASLFPRRALEALAAIGSDDLSLAAEELEGGAR